jgi:hypothetical protein
MVVKWQGWVLEPCLWFEAGFARIKEFFVILSDSEESIEDYQGVACGTGFSLILHPALSASQRTYPLHPLTHLFEL